MLIILLIKVMTAPKIQQYRMEAIRSIKLREFNIKSSLANNLTLLQQEVVVNYQLEK